jgi:hypothetical protein
MVDIHYRTEEKESVGRGEGAIVDSIELGTQVESYHSPKNAEEGRGVQEGASAAAKSY